jgi:hypothetical protein
MASKIFIRGGQVTAVYDDRFMPLFKALGDIEIQRASNVEFDGQWWVAFRPNKGEKAFGNQILAEGPNRNEVIKQEVEFLEKEMSLESHRNS